MMGGLSIISLFNTGFTIGWVQPLREVIEQYLVITNTFRQVVEPYIFPMFNALADFFTLGVNFGQHWPDIFLLMIIYLGSRIKSYISGAKYFRAVGMFILSIYIAIIGAFFASSIILESWSKVLIATVIPLLGFLVYDVAYAFVGASLDRGRTPWVMEFRRHVRFSVPLLAISFLLNAALSNVLVLKMGVTTYQAFIIIFSIDYIVISAYWAYLSLRHARNRNNCLMDESVFERFWRSSATNVALNVGIVLLSALFFMVCNAGLQTAGFEASVLLPKSL